MKCCKCNSNIMELDIVTFKPYSIKNNFQFKINEVIINTDIRLCTFEEMFHGMFLMTEIYYKLSSLIVQSLGKFSSEYSKTVNTHKVNFMRKMYSYFKDNRNFKQL